LKHVVGHRRSTEVEWPTTEGITVDIKERVAMLNKIVALTANNKVQLNVIKDQVGEANVVAILRHGATGQLSNLKSRVKRVEEMKELKSLKERVAANPELAAQLGLAEQVDMSGDEDAGN